MGTLERHTRRGLGIRQMLKAAFKMYFHQRINFRRSSYCQKRGVRPADAFINRQNVYFNIFACSIFSFRIASDGRQKHYFSFPSRFFSLPRSFPGFCSFLLLSISTGKRKRHKPRLVALRIFRTKSRDYCRN